MNEMGGLDQIVAKLPGANRLSANQISHTESNLQKSVAIIDSMTKKERIYPKLLDASRKKRIAKGSGTSVAEINQLIKQINTMQKMMKKIKNSRFLLKIV